MSKTKLRADAINRFIVDAKAAGVWDSLEAATILCGWDSLAGALTPLVGSAPTNNGFIDSDLDAGIGLVGDASSKYLDSGAKPAATSATSLHMSAFVSDTPNVSGSSIYVGSDDGASARYLVYGNTDVGECRVLFGNAPSFLGGAGSLKAGILAASRDSSSDFDVRYVDGSFESSAASGSSALTNAYVFARNNSGPNLYTDATLGWYSIGSSVDLAALDTVVSQLMSDLRSIDEAGMDRDALAYCRAVEAEDGSFLETDVKQAIDRLIKGLKYDGLWDSIGASCLLCGPRTISGALVPIRGEAPTAEGGWTSSDYDRATGMQGDGSSLYLDTNRANDVDGQDDQHLAVYISAAQTAAKVLLAAGGTSFGASTIGGYDATGGSATRSRNNAFDTQATGQTILGLNGNSRSSAGNYTAYANGTASTEFRSSQSPTADTLFAFARSDAGIPTFFSDARLAFYSIGSSLDLSKLDSRISQYVTDIAAAIP